VWWHVPQRPHHAQRCRPREVATYQDRVVEAEYLAGRQVVHPFGVTMKPEEYMTPTENYHADPDEVVIPTGGRACCFCDTHDERILVEIQGQTICIHCLYGYTGQQDSLVTETMLAVHRHTGKPMPIDLKNAMINMVKDAQRKMWEEAAAQLLADGKVLLVSKYLPDTPTHDESEG
jgi:hypothetical protein